MKRRAIQSRKRRDRKTGQSPYQKYHKTPYVYSWERKGKEPAK
jgi:hypothetical protein